MSDPLEEIYERFLAPHTETEIEQTVTCPKCGSDNVDTRSGYRGEYKCLDCGHSWQVGGGQSS